MKKILLITVFLFPLLTMAKTIQIKMLNVTEDGPMAFSPGFVKADIGDTIEFLPTDAAHGAGSLFIPEGGSPWKGELNKKVSTKVTKEGVYLYECNPHSTMGMVGVIQVGQKLNNLESAKKFAADYSKRFVMNKDRFDIYLKKVAP